MKFAGANSGSSRTHPQWIPKVDEQKGNLEQVMTMLKSYGQELMIWHLALKSFNVSRQMTVRDLTTMRKSNESRIQPKADPDGASSSTPSSEAPEAPGKEITVVKNEEGKFSTVTVDEDQNLSILKTEELDEFESQLMDQVAVYLDPDTGLAEDSATRKARYTFDGVLRKAFANFPHLISTIPAGNISALLRSMMIGSKSTKQTLFYTLKSMFALKIEQKGGINGYLSELQGVKMKCERLGMILHEPLLASATLATAGECPLYKQLSTQLARGDSALTFGEIAEELREFEGNLRLSRTYDREWQKNTRGRDTVHQARGAAPGARNAAWSQPKDSDGKVCCILRILQGKCSRHNCPFSHECPSDGWDAAAVHARSMAGHFSRAVLLHTRRTSAQRTLGSNRSILQKKEPRLLERAKRPLPLPKLKQR